MPTICVPRIRDLNPTPSQIGAQIDENDSKTVIASVPPTRSDILHQCDIMEDVAIAYGFNNIKPSFPKSATVGKEQPLNHFTDLLRMEISMAGFTEMLTWALQSHADNFDNLNRVEDTDLDVKMLSATAYPHGKAVTIGNPKTLEFQECRLSLLGSAMKTLGENKKAPLPLKLFEISDVVVQDEESDVGARNERRLVAVFTNSKGAGFEVIHGLLDRIMTVVGISHQSQTKCSSSSKYYYIKAPEVDERDGAFFPGREARVIFHNGDSGDIVLGLFGVVHPEVLSNYDVVSPTSAIEINIEPFVVDQFGNNLLKQ